jgi:hypothetical protein
MTPQEEAVIAQAIAAGKLVDAIKMVRTATGVSLSEAKMVVLSLAGSLPHGRAMQQGFQKSLAMDDDPRQAVIVRAIVIVTIALVLALFAGIVALLAHTHAVRG